MISYSAENDLRGTILVVDDDPGMRELLRTILTADGFEVVSVSRGDEALAQIETAPPDVVLLDVSLPGIDGIEVCRRLHADPSTAPIPVLLLTGHRSREKRLDGIAAGARDFLLKPVDRQDLLVRVRNAAERKQLYDESEQRFRRITELEALRDSLVHMVVHDLKSPLTAVMGNLQLMEMIVSEEMDPDLRIALDGSVAGARKMNEMIGTILAVSKLESDTMTLDIVETDLVEVVEESRSVLGERASRVLIVEPPRSLEHVALDVDLVQRVILNLLTNALEHSPEEHPVVVRFSMREELARVTVEDRGSGIRQELREQIFEKFGQGAGGGRSRRGSVGLGLAFCKMAVEAHGGRIGVESSKEGGSAFWFELPLRGPEVEPS